MTMTIAQRRAARTIIRELQEQLVAIQALHALPGVREAWRAAPPQQRREIRRALCQLLVDFSETDLDSPDPFTDAERVESTMLPSP